MHRLSVFIFFLILTSEVAPSQEAPPANSQQIITQMFSGRERLGAGDVRIRGVEKRVTFRQNVNKTNSRDIAERLRFDLSRASVWHEVELHNLDSQPTENPLHRVTVFSASAAYCKSVEAKQITIAAPSAPSKFWDVRAFGIATAVDVMDFTRLSEHKPAFTYYLDRSRVTIEGPDTQGIAVATIEHGSDPNARENIDGRSRFWIDTSRGYVPIRMEGQELDAQASTPGRRVWKEPNDLSSTSWELINGVWVPTSFSVKHVVGVAGLDSLEISFDLTMEWLSVNPEFKEEEFSLAKLDIPKGSHLIIDARRDPPLIVQKPGILDTTTRWRMPESVAPTERSLNIKN